MSMFKKLKSIFIIEDENAASVESTPPTPKSTGTKAPSETAAKSKTITTTSKLSAGKDAKPDNKFVDMLLKAIEANNIEGFDYLEFKQSLQSLSKIETDEAKRFQNAFAMAQTMGLDKKKLFDSAKRYVAVLNDEEAKFSDAFTKQKTTQVEQRTTKVENLKKAITTKEQQIKKLQEEIEKAKAELKGIEGKINESLAKVEATKDGFYASYNMVLGQIKSDIDKIDSYIS